MIVSKNKLGEAFGDLIYPVLVVSYQRVCETAGHILVGVQSQHSKMLCVQSNIYVLLTLYFINSTSSTTVLPA